MKPNKNSRFRPFIVKETPLPQRHFDAFDAQAEREGRATSRAKNEFCMGSSLKAKKFVGGTKTARPATSRGNVLNSEHNAKQSEYGN